MSVAGGSDKNVQRELKELKEEVKKMQAANQKRMTLMQSHRQGLLDDVARGSADTNNTNDSLEARLRDYHRKSLSAKIAGASIKSKSMRSAVTSSSSRSGSRAGGSQQRSPAPSTRSPVRLGPRRSLRRKSVLKPSLSTGGSSGGKRKKAASKKKKKKVTLTTPAYAASDTSSTGAEVDSIPSNRSGEVRRESEFKHRNSNRRQSLSSKLFKGDLTRVRGRVAKKIRVNPIFRFLGHNYTMIIMELTICLLYYIYFFLTVYQSTVGFGSLSGFGSSFLQTCDFIFIGDLLYRLLVQVIRNFADLDYDLLLIPCTPGFWIFHIICLCPFQVYGELMGVMGDRISLLQLSIFGRWNRWGLMYRIWVFLEILEEEQYLSQKSSFLIAFYFLYTVFVQLVAFVLWTIVPGQVLDHFFHRYEKLIEGSWIEYAYRSNPGIVPNPINNFILTLSFATSMVTTVGYGDPAPRTETEMLVGIFAMLVGAIALAGWFGSNFTGFLLAKDKARYELFHRAEVIQEHLQRLGASALFAEKTKEFYECLWNYREGVYRVEMIKLLPSSMHEDIIFDICSEMFHKTLMFRGLDEPFLRAVSHTVDVAIYNPEMILCLQGERPTCMYYIIQGECIAKTPHSSNQTSAILRPGCVFGELSLFLSFAHTTNVETRTCCQLLVIHKDRLQDVCKQFPDSLAVMRARFRARMTRLLENYTIHGTYPILWSTRKLKLHDRATTATLFPDYPLTVRWADGFNRLVPNDVVETAQLPVIVEMHCLNPEYANDDIDTYGTCVLPVTLTFSSIHFWHLGVLLVGVPYFFAYIFVEFVDLAIVQGPSVSLLQIVPKFDAFVSIIYLVDLFIEVFTATPSSGLIFYKFTDGLRVKSKQWSFYVDLYSIIPFIDLTDDSESGAQFVIHFVNNAAHIVIGRGLKIVFRIVRYFDYLNEVYPKNIFLIRVTEAIVFLVMHSHVLACLLFFIACSHPTFIDKTKGVRQCHGFNWFNSFYIDALLRDDEYIPKEITPNGIVNSNPYLLSMYFSIATWSSAGYGDFDPQNRIETLVLIIVQLWGFYLIGSITAKLTSALSCVSIAQINFEKKLQSMKIFFQLHGLTMKLRDRITEHYKLQFYYNRGIELPAGVYHLMYDAPPYLAEDALYAEMSVHLEGVPLFTHMDPTILTHMATLVKRYILPPNIIFLHRGDVRREMYIVKSGSVAIIKEDSDEIKYLLEETGHFGVRDLIFGEPSFNTVKTLSYCVLYAISYNSFNLACGQDLSLLLEIEEHRGRLEERIELLNMVYKVAQTTWDPKERKPTEVPAWIVFPTKDKPANDVCTYEEFVEAYEGCCANCCKWFLMRRTIHPAGTFALFWCLLTATAGLIFLIAFTFELLLDYTSTTTMLIVALTKLVFIVDIYVRMHWGYYTDSNYLICHPAQTATHYLLEGPFVYSLFIEIAEYAFALRFLNAIDWTFHGEGEKWDQKLEMVRLSHLMRVPIFFQFGHNVSRHRTKILLFIYVMLTLALCSVLASFALYFACPWDQSKYDPTRAEKVRACLAGKWTDTKVTLRDDINVMWKRWVIAIYYISQTVLVIGYGDMVTLDRTEIIQLCIMMLFGFIVTRCVIADFSAFIISDDSLRAEYLERIYRITTVMRKQSVDSKLISIVDEHLQHTWVMCKGLQPRELLKDLHPALQSDLFKEYIGDAVTRVPLWNGLNDCVIRNLCTYMKKLYFTRGERIARKGNLEFEMYVIVDGDVWITGRHLQYRCTLGAGETFGETQMMYGLVRGYSAVAASHVEVFALSASDFAEVLEHYPDLKRHMEERLGWLQVDLFEKKVDFIQERQQLAGRGFFVTAEARITRIIQESVSEREVFAVVSVEAEGENAGEKKKPSKLGILWRQYVCDWGQRDSNLPFFYLAAPPGATKPSFLVHPKCGFYQQFSRLVVLVSLASAVLGMYLMVFSEGPSSGPFELAKKEPYFSHYIIFPYTIYFFEIIYVIHIVLQFFVPFPTVEGKYCKERKRICYMYTRSVSRFWVDLISTLPIELYPQTMIDSEMDLDLLNIIRALRLINFYRSLNESYETIHVTTFRYNIINSVTSFFLTAHVLAILFYFFSECRTPAPGLVPIGTGDDAVCIEGTWPAFCTQVIRDFLDGQDTPPEDLVAWKWYVRSLYWVVTTISTTGFGDIVAHTLAEIAMSIICIFYCAFVLAYILSLFTSGITSLTQHNREYLYQLQTMTKYMGNLGLSAAWQNSLTEWFLYRWKISRGTSFNNAIEILPLTLQTTVNLALYQETLTQVALFRGMQPRFFRALVSFIEHIVYLPGQVIENEGNHGNHLFIVSQGRVSGYALNRHGQPKLMRWYDEGCCFGRLPAFFYDQVYTKTYRAEVATEILTINKHSLFYLARYFHEFEKRLRRFLEETYDASLGTDTILSPATQPLAGTALGFFPKNISAPNAPASFLIPSRRSKGVNTKRPKEKRIKKKYYKKKKGLKLVVNKDKQRQEEAYIEAKTRQLLDAFEKVQGSDADEGSVSRAASQMSVGSATTGKGSKGSGKKRKDTKRKQSRKRQSARSALGRQSAQARRRSMILTEGFEEYDNRMIQFDARSESIKKANL